MHLKRTGILTKLILLILLIYAAVSLVRLHGQIREAEQNRDALAQQVLDTTAENDDMRYAIDHSTDEDVLRDIARKDLGLGEPGEKVYGQG